MTGQPEPAASPRHAGWPVRELVEETLADPQVQAHAEWLRTHPPGARYPEPEPDDPPRCWSCGHPWDAGCECSCCGDDAPEGWGPDAI